jgi:hypothetical protein
MPVNWSEVWKYTRDLGPTVGLLVSAIGLALNGIGLLRTAKVARNTFMLHFYDRVQKFNPIHLYLREGWPQGAQGPSSAEEWNEVARYMGLFEGLWRLIQDKAYPRDRADLDYSHRIIALVCNPSIRQRFLDEGGEESGGWGDFIELWRCLESGHVYSGIVADLVNKKRVAIPKAPRPHASRRRWWQWGAKCFL